MSYFNHTVNAPVKLSVIIASILATSCGHIDFRNGIFNDSSSVAQQEESSDENQPMAISDISSDNFENIDKNDPRFILTQAADLAVKEKKHPEALKYLEQLTNQYPDYVQGYMKYSQVGRKINLHRNVLSKLYNAKTKFPNDVQITSEIAKVQYEMKDYNQALKEVDNAIKLNNSDWKLYSLRGIINDKMGYFTESQSSYAKALELSPDNPTILNNMAASQMLNKHYEEAEILATKAIQNDNVNIQAYRTYAKILVLKGDNDKALEVLTTKLKDKNKAEQVISSVSTEVSKPAYWGRN